MWGQNTKYLEQLPTLQNKAIKIINFIQHDHPADELYNGNGILKIKEYIDLLNCLFVKSVLSKESLAVFCKYFKRSHNLHNHRTWQASLNSVKTYHMNTQSYRDNSVRNKLAFTWNLIVNKIKKDQSLSLLQMLKRWPRLSLLIHIKISKLQANVSDL